MKQIMGAARSVNIIHTLTSDRMDGLKVRLCVDTESGNQVEFVLPNAILKGIFAGFMTEVLKVNGFVYALEAQEQIKRRQ